MSNNAPFSSTVEVHSPECSYSQQMPVCKEGQSDHRWSGWPGAFCLDCHIGDPAESCMGGCKCECHEAFWQEYEEWAIQDQIDKCEYWAEHPEGGSCMHCTSC